MKSIVLLLAFSAVLALLVVQPADAQWGWGWGHGWGDYDGYWGYYPYDGWGWGGHYWGKREAGSYPRAAGSEIRKAR